MQIVLIHNETDTSDSYDERLLKKIEHVIHKPNNIDDVMDILTGQELEYLIKIGYLFQPRNNEYRLLR